MANKNTQIEVFGFSGKLGTGKNYIAEQVFQKMMPQKQTAVLAFADQIKVDGIVKEGLDRYKCFVEKDEVTRATLQRIGTEEGRDVHGEDLWKDYIREWIMVHASRGIERFILSDIRFENEFNLVKEFEGINIRVNASERNRARLLQETQGDEDKADVLAAHRSEISLDDCNTFDYVIDNNPEHDAVLQVREMIKDIKNKNKRDLVIFCDVDDTICECGIYYTQLIEEVRLSTYEALNCEIDEDFFNEQFKKQFRQEDGGYYKTFFELDRFANALRTTVESFEDYIIPYKYEKLCQEAYDLGMSVFDFNYKPIQGRVDQIKDLQKVGKVVLFTMGDHLEQSKKICSLGIQHLDFEIFDFKDETIFRNLMHKYPAKSYAMVGDSLHRDVIPARNAGIDYPTLITSKEQEYVIYDEVEEGGYKVVSSLSELASQLSLELYQTELY